MQDPIPPSFSRRAFLKGASLAAVAGGLPASSGADPGQDRSSGKTFGPGEHALQLEVNGEMRELRVEPRTTLLDTLRDRLDLTGAKKVCDRGACGACTVLVDGKAVNSCLMLALDAEGAAIRTIEGLAREGQLHPLQQAFVECDALQCGFCTPGMVMAGVACLEKHGRPTLAQVQHELAGNLCRCGTYGRVFAAVQQAANAQGGR